MRNKCTLNLRKCQTNQNHYKEMESFAVILFCFSLTSVFIVCSGLDTIAANQTIRDGDTIVSADETYELGFFSPTNSKLRYLGIWYKKISAGTVVWVANRETPLNDSSGVLKLDESGTLALFNQTNSIVWSSNTSRPAGSPVAQLLESGNLVVRDENDYTPENFLWQSFDYPGNTFLPGMKIGRTADGRNWYLTSWKSSDDPSLGDFMYELDPSGLQIVITQNSVFKARSGPWNGVRFSGMPYLKPNTIFNYTFVYKPLEKYYTYELMNRSVFTRIVLKEIGVMDRYTWIDRTSDWNRYLTAPADNCDAYAICGVYGNCKVDNSPMCGCLDKFEPINQKDWDRADWSGGCVRRTPLDCQKGDGFIKYTNVRLPDTQNVILNASLTLEECKMMCLTNCSCMAYANSDIRGGGSGCYLWFDNLTDIKQFAENGQDLYVRMAASEIDVDSHGKKQIGIIVAIILPAGLLLLGLSLFLWRKKKRNSKKKNKKNKKKEKKERKQNIQGKGEDDQYHGSVNNQEEDLDLPHFDLKTVANATNNFSPNNLIGEGGFGPVYKGVFQEGQAIAVKKLSKDSRQGLDEFKNEVKCIAKLQHRNLVKLLGYCIQLDEKMLIYEYMPNKSLDFYIFDKTRSKTVDWPKRFRIINGISRGLLYLHQDSRLRVIHRDLKLSNILLDNDMNPKISDFGMARIFGGDETAANTKRVVGTYGYMSPEYAIDGLFSTKSDVFSFGVLVIEIVTGSRNRGFIHADHQLNLLGHAWRQFNEGRFTGLIDASMVYSCNLSEVLRTIHVGLLCVQHSPEDRPSMSSVALMLAGEGSLPQPKEPGFYTERKLFEAGESSSASGMHDSCSVNEITVTMIDAR